MKSALRGLVALVLLLAGAPAQSAGFISQILRFSNPQIAAAAAAAGDPLAATRRLAGKTMVECNGALETVMLLAQLGTVGPSQNEFQAQARARFALYTNHPAVRETAALMERGFGYEELALLSTFMSPAPYFLIEDSPELPELADRLPGPRSFALDRLHGYAKLVREFYWDTRVGQFLRSSLASYQQAVRRTPPSGVPAGARLVLSLLAPTARIELKRRTPRPATYWILGN